MKTRTIIKAGGYHTDQLGHANHARFIELLEQGLWRYMEENGVLNLFHSMGPGHVVIRIALDYTPSGEAVMPYGGLVSKWHDLAMASEEEDANG
jgi:hypothetical protein